MGEKQGNRNGKGGWNEMMVTRENGEIGERKRRERERERVSLNSNACWIWYNLCNLNTLTNTFYIYSAYFTNSIPLLDGCVSSCCKLMLDQ